VEPVVEPTKGWGRKNLRQIQIIPAMTPLIARVIPNSPAEEAGLRAGDLVIAANAQTLYSGQTLAELLSATKGAPVTLTIRRGSTDFPISITPRIPEGEKQVRLGIQWDQRGLVRLVHPDPITQIKSSLLTMWETISAVTARHSEIGVQQLSGPVGIMRIYYLLFQSPMGWQLALWFSVVLNVNLAVMNMLPLPVLDGGHILLAFIEWICGHPIHQKTLEIVQTTFAMLLIGTMLYISFYDVSDLVKGHKSAAAATSDKTAEIMTFSPKSPASTVAAPSPVSPPKP
jgi:regulator of sigma E protease